MTKYISLAMIVLLVIASSMLNAQTAGLENANKPVREFQASTRGWGVVCQALKAGGSLVCEASQSISEGNGKPFLAITLIHTKEDAFAMKMQLPHGLDLTTPVTMQVDSDEIINLPFNTSLPTGSFITSRLSKGFILAMRRGKTLNVHFKGVNKSDINVPVSLVGLTRALNKVSSN